MKKISRNYKRSRSARVSNKRLPSTGKSETQGGAVPETIKCPGCKSTHPASVLEEHLYVCPECNWYLPMPSRTRIATLADPGTFRELDHSLVSVDPLDFSDLKSYRSRLEKAREETGVREAVTTGLCRMANEPVVLVVFDFGFLGGTMGSVVGEKIAHAFEVAVERQLPLVSVTASGGARVQEGMFSLMQMAKVSAAASRHDAAGLAFISVLTDPTFGGVTASFASLGDAIVAEPGAQIGFVGPRVIEQTTGIAPPKDSHRAETLLQAGRPRFGCEPPGPLFGRRISHGASQETEGRTFCRRQSAAQSEAASASRLGKGGPGAPSRTAHDPLLYCADDYAFFGIAWRPLEWR